MNSIREIIESAAPVEQDLVSVIERIMREDIFHGPLDWQSADELTMAAKDALAIYESDKEFHDADTRFRKARWGRVLAERKASEAQYAQSLRISLEAAQEAEQSALRDLQSFTLRPANTP